MPNPTLVSTYLQTPVGKVMVFCDKDDTVTRSGVVGIKATKPGKQVCLFSDKDGTKLYYKGEIIGGSFGGEGEIFGDEKSYSAKGIFSRDGFEEGNVVNSPMYGDQGILYSGKMLRFYPHGRGKVVYPNDSVLEGTFVEGKLDQRCVCKILFPDGSNYQGLISFDPINPLFPISSLSLDSKKFDGQGKLTFADKKQYLEGQFLKDGVFFGKGVLHGKCEKELSNADLLSNCKGFVLNGFFEMRSTESTESKEKYEMFLIKNSRISPFRITSENGEVLYKEFLEGESDGLKELFCNQQGMILTPQEFFESIEKKKGELTAKDCLELFKYNSTFRFARLSENDLEFYRQQQSQLEDIQNAEQQSQLEDIQNAEQQTRGEISEEYEKSKTDLLESFNRYCELIPSKNDLEKMTDEERADWQMLSEMRIYLLRSQYITDPVLQEDIEAFRKLNSSLREKVADFESILGGVGNTGSSGGEEFKGMSWREIIKYFEGGCSEGTSTSTNVSGVTTSSSGTSPSTNVSGVTTSSSFSLLPAPSKVK